MEIDDLDVKELAAVLERFPRFRQALLDVDVWWHDDGRMQFRVVTLDHPEIREGMAALAEVFDMDVEDLPPDAPEPEMPDWPSSRFGDRVEARSPEWSGGS